MAVHVFCCSRDYMKVLVSLYSSYTRKTIVTITSTIMNAWFLSASLKKICTLLGSILHHIHYNLISIQLVLTLDRNKSPIVCNYIQQKNKLLDINVVTYYTTDTKEMKCYILFIFMAHRAISMIAFPMVQCMFIVISVTYANMCCIRSQRSGEQAQSINGCGT